MKLLQFLACIFISGIADVSIQACVPSCDCQENLMRCHGNHVPTVLPDQIKEAYFTQFTPFPEHNFPFTDKSWTGLTKLDLTLVYPSKNKYLARQAFTGLSNLEYLGVHGIDGTNSVSSEDFEVHEESLLGLDNLKTLNMSGNSILFADEHLLKLLKLPSIVPRLETLDVTKIQRFHGSTINLSFQFFKTLSTRPLKTLIMDDTNIAVNFEAMHNYVCDTLQEVSLRHVNLVDMWYHCDTDCPLRLLDLSYASIPLLLHGLHASLTPGIFTAADFSSRLGFLYSTSQLNINYFNLNPVRIEDGHRFNMTGVHFRVRVLEFQGNNLQWMNASFIDLKFPEDSELALSDNGLQYFSPSILPNGEFIRKVNASNNELHIMASQYKHDFTIALDTFPNLEEIDLSLNQLYHIPETFFDRNLKLVSIYLSRNNLKSITFMIVHLENLRYLDLQSNQIHTLDSHQMHAIDHLFSVQTQLTKKQDETNVLPRQHSNSLEPGEEFKVQMKTTDKLMKKSAIRLNLQGNDLKCTCGDFKFMEWMQKSGVLDRGAEQYECEFEGDMYETDEAGLAIMKGICYHRHAVKLVAISASAALVLFGSMVVLIVFVRKRQLKRERTEKLVKDIKNGKFKGKFLVFLSYSSEDTDIVCKNIYPQIKDQLSLLTGTTQELVCFGDRDFRPGIPIINEVMTCMEKSSMMVCVTSRTYCEKNWCQMEIKEACTQNKPIILLFLENVPLNIMSPFMQKIFHRYTRSKIVKIDDGSYEPRPSWAVICKSILEVVALSSEEKLGLEAPGKVNEGLGVP